MFLFMVFVILQLMEKVEVLQYFPLPILLSHHSLLLSFTIRYYYLTSYCLFGCVFSSLVGLLLVGMLFVSS
jgi:hypothetical protein